MSDEENRKRVEILQKVKIALWALLGVAVIIFLLSNLGSMELSLLFGLLAPISAPKAFFIMFFLVAGFGAGFGACLFWMRTQRRSKAAGKEEDGEPCEDEPSGEGGPGGEEA